MIKNALWISVAAVALGASAAGAGGFTERMATERMTVVQVDRAQGRFLCAEHGRWTRIAKTDVAILASGDIVTVGRPAGGPARVTVVRTAAEELASPER
jgi:hypothetical protein